jgi:hypothetical protein
VVAVEQELQQQKAVVAVRLAQVVLVVTVETVLELLAQHQEVVAAVVEHLFLPQETTERTV